jgi:cytochrome c oxidase subunit 2
VVHGFLVQGSNVNAMLIPGYVTHITSRFKTTGEHMMPCHEFCGIGHQGMWARVRVIDRQAFSQLIARHRRVSCATE